MYETPPAGTDAVLVTEAEAATDAAASTADATIGEAAAAAQRYVARGHDIIRTELARADQLAAAYPAVAALLPVIRSALVGLWAHMNTPVAQSEAHAADVAALAAQTAEDHSAS